MFRNACAAMRASVGPILPPTPRIKRSLSSVCKAAKACGEGSASSASNSSSVVITEGSTGVEIIGDERLSIGLFLFVPLG